MIVFKEPQKVPTWKCGKCHKQTSGASGSGVCSSCESEGWWIDPAGGMHCDPEGAEFSDPAKMYE